MSRMLVMARKTRCTEVPLDTKEQSMVGPSEDDWSFKSIRIEDSARADRLESVGSPADLAMEISDRLDAAFNAGMVRIGVDSKGNKQDNHRAVFQFRVGRNLYDWFYNSRTGYRAQFWISPQAGLQFNQNLMRELVDVLDGFLENRIECCYVRFFENPKRHDRYTKNRPLEKATYLASLRDASSKIWICERLIPPEPDECVELLSKTSLPKLRLDIPMWTNAIDPKTESKPSAGIWAECPEQDYCWLDLKGAFVFDDGNVCPSKDPGLRSIQIHKTGWT